MGDNNNCLSEYVEHFYYDSVFKFTNKEPINELQIMDKINTQQEAIKQVKNGTYIIGSVEANGLVSFSATPSIQYNSQNARAECKHLAAINPGTLFIFVKLSGGEMVPNATVSI